MKAWQAFFVGVFVTAAFSGFYIWILAERPDYNPFVAYRMFANLRTMSTIESLNGEIRDIFDKSQRYPPDRAALLAAVETAKPRLASAVAGIPFTYTTNGDSYLLFWTSGEGNNRRARFLVEDGEYYLSLESYVERRLAPSFVGVEQPVQEPTGGAAEPG